MTEYIEREALMRRIKEIHCAECDNYHGVRCRACWVDDTLGYIDSEPPSDVALVVQCKDCLYSRERYGHIECIHGVSYRNTWNKPDFYCSYGERKDGDD